MFRELRLGTKNFISDITPKFVRILERFSPFGPDNMRPVFLTENVLVAHKPRVVGANHLVLTLKQDNKYKTLNAIGFNLGKYSLATRHPNNTSLDIVYTMLTVYYIEYWQ